MDPTSGTREPGRGSAAAVQQWIARFGPSLKLVLAAEITFTRIVEQAAERPDEDTVHLVATARQQMIAAAEVLSAADPVPDRRAAELLGEVLRGIDELARRTNPANAGDVTVARPILTAERLLVDLVQRLIDLRH